MDEKALLKLIELMKTAPGKVVEMLNGPGKEMSVKELLKKDEGAKNIDIAELGIGDFKPIARRYGMDFAVVKSKYLDPPKYTVFFKARDEKKKKRGREEEGGSAMNFSEAPLPGGHPALQEGRILIEWQ